MDVEHVARVLNASFKPGAKGLPRIEIKGLVRLTLRINVEEASLELVADLKQGGSRRFLGSVSLQRVVRYNQHEGFVEFVNEQGSMLTVFADGRFKYASA